MLVHITLNLTEDEVDAKGETVLEELHRVGVREVDTKFLRRYSLLTGHIDQANVHAVENLPMVAAVEPDGEVIAM